MTNHKFSEPELTSPNVCLYLTNRTKPQIFNLLQSDVKHKKQQSVPGEWDISVLYIIL